jgi:SAM-dependent methyltransferase
VKEADIRPRQLFDTYLRLLEEDTRTFFGDHRTFEIVPCPGCGKPEGREAFTKSGFVYVECPGCATLWASPRPAAARLDDFYRTSPSVQYWHTAFYRETAEARREHMFRPRAVALGELLDARGIPSGGTFADIGAGYGIFLDEIRRLERFRDVIGIEPNPGMAAVCRERGFHVVEKSLEAVIASDVTPDIVTAFEVLEHVWDPLRFLTSAVRMLAPRGWLVLTTLTVSGFDIQMLWERSTAVSPPQHLNLLSVEGMRLLVERAGFEIVELSTPGRLDVDIVANALERDPGLPLPRFVKTLLTSGDTTVRDRFQEFLRASRLSSHVRVVARKP